jgi:L-lactate dehydrogenase (cytochrome)
MAIVTHVEDLRQIAQGRIPRALFDYVDRGSYDELTLRANRADLDALTLRQRVLVDVSNVKLKTSILGEDLSMPVVLAPTGMAGLIRGDGEIHAACAAQAAGTNFCLSTMSICTLEEVRAAARPFWFQLYVFRDRGFSRAMIERARAADCPVLMVTVDLPMRGQRHLDIKNGLTVPPRLTIANLLDFATCPAWALSVLRARRRSFGNIEAYLKSGPGMYRSASWANENFDRSLSWRDLEWIRQLWPGKLVLKGILDVDDARQAADAGADAIVVSNHGGRQLDGGIRSGQDVLKALARGARGTLIGRAFLYGLAADGRAGVAKALDLIRAELEVAMALTGQRDVSKVGREVVVDAPSL